MSQPVQLFLLVAAILTAVIALHYWTTRRVNARLQALIKDKSDAGAGLTSECMVREGYFEEPAVAQVAGQHLSIWTVTGRTFQLPLEDLKLMRVRRNNWLGRYPWWGKTLLYLEAPGTSGLVLGIKDSEPWLKRLEKTVYLQAAP